MTATRKTLLLAATFSLIAGTSAADEVEVLWLGHATTRFTSVTGKVIVIDPFLTKNPMTPREHKDLEALGKVDLILVTHGHSDHVGDLFELARSSGAIVVANFEYARCIAAIKLSTAAVDPLRTQNWIPELRP